MDFDIGSILSVVNFVIGNPLVLGGVVGCFVGWNLPQPSWAKYIQDKIVSGVTYVWGKIKNNSVVKKLTFRK